MKILILTPFLAYPGASGGGTAVFNLIRNLALRHEIVYLSFARREDLPHLALVKSYCAETVVVPFPGGEGMSALAEASYLARRCLHNVLSFVTLTPVLVWKCRSGAMRRALLRTIERHRPDAVHICFPQMADYVRFSGEVPAVMDTQDVATVSMMRRARSAPDVAAKAYYFVQWLFWRRYESHYYRMFGKVLTLTRQDAAALKDLNPELDVYADAIGVDVQSDVAAQCVTSGRIGFLANFAHQPNVDAALHFAEAVFPLIRARFPGATFVVAGKNPPPPLLDPARIGVDCVGFVADVTTFYGSVDVIVAPLRFGGGIKIKVLEAMACGRPVVTTSVGAEGITEPEEGALLVADEPAVFADAVSTLLEDGVQRTALGERARQLVERRFSWLRVMDDLDRIYAELVRVKR